MVVLVEPAGPINVGSVARLCANFAVSELRLVAPRCDPHAEDAVRMAVHGKALLTQASIHPSLLDAVQDCRRTIATCGRLDHGEIPLHPPEVGLAWLNMPPSPEQALIHSPIAVVFGREDRGLTNDELRLCQRVVTLHSDPTYPSLNLSHAVAVILHELKRLQATECNTAQPAEAVADPAPAAEMQGFLDDAQDLLLDIGFLLEHTVSARMAKLQNLLQRASARREEVALLRGMIRQTRWAIRSHRT